jgi:hypothetical protein
MIIAIEPTDFRVPGQGVVSVNQLEVRVSSYTLGVSAQAFYDLQSVTAVEKTRTNEDGTTKTYSENETESFGLNGNDSLTEEQFANWGEDDLYFANCIAENLGLVPATE